MGVVVSWIVFATVADPSAQALAVTGATACPVAAEVEAALTGLIPARDPGSAPDVAELKDDAGSVVVSLRRGSEPIGEKRLEPGLDCAQRARAAAVIVAAWEARLATPAAPLVVQPPPPAASPPVVVAPPATTLPYFENNVEVGASFGGSI